MADRDIKVFVSEYRATEFQKAMAYAGYETARYRRLSGNGWRYDVEYWRATDARKDGNECGSC